LTLASALRRANAIHSGAARTGAKIDPRWQAIIAIGEFVETEPEAVWEFCARWGKHASADLRSAIATCLLEHLLEHHFDLIFPRVERLATSSRRFADTLDRCGRFGQATRPRNSERLDRLIDGLKTAARPSRRTKRRGR
jgi:hypothetical protein